MTLPSGADVQIGQYGFMLIGEDSYRYERIPEASETVFVWDHDDWSGGEGQRYFDPEQPNRYFYGRANTRIPGSVAAPPTRSQVTVGSTASSVTAALLVLGTGALWAFADRHAFYSTDAGGTWTAHPSNPIFAAGYKITAATAIGEKVWVSAHDGTTRRVKEIDTTTETTAVNDVTGPPFLGMATRGGYVFGWTGKTLLRYNSRATLPITQDARHKVYQPFVDTLPANYWGGMAETERSVIMLFATPGRTTVHEFRAGAGVDIWHIRGLTGKAIAHNNGVAYVLGEGESGIELHALGMANLQPVPVGQVGIGDGATDVRALAPAYSDTILIGATNGTDEFVYVYDLERDALSQLDSRPTSEAGPIYSLALYRSRRISLHASGTTLTVNRWVRDTATPSGDWSLTTSAWDLGLPYIGKQLMGVHVVQDPAGGTVQVLYDADETGSFTAVGTTTSGSKHTYLDIASSNVTFRTLRLRLVGASGCRVLSVAPRIRLTSYRERWRLAVAVTDGRTSARPRTTGPMPAEVLRSYLRDMHAAGVPVTFLDGRRYQKPGGSGVGYSSHTVTIDALSETIGPNGEGVMVLELNSVTPT